jgi:hypothetical protein
VLIRSYTHIGRTKRLHLHNLRFESKDRRNTIYGRGKSSLASTKPLIKKTQKLYLL